MKKKHQKAQKKVKLYYSVLSVTSVSILVVLIKAHIDSGKISACSGGEKKPIMSWFSQTGLGKEKLLKYEKKKSEIKFCENDLATGIKHLKKAHILSTSSLSYKNPA